MVQHPRLVPARVEAGQDARLGLRWAVFVIVSAALLAVGLLAGQELGRRQAAAEAKAQLSGLAALSVSALTSELDKQRVLDLVLAEDPEVRDAVADPSAASLAAMDAKFSALRNQTGASVIYLIGSEGVAIAASNWRDSDSFVGVDYRFRDYYRGAVAAGSAEQFAFGNVSLRPGAYLARRVVGTGGVLVIKVEFQTVERDWLHTGDRLVLTDTQGIVLLASEPRWRFRTVGRLDEAMRDKIRAGQQYGADVDLSPLPIKEPPGSGLVAWDGRLFVGLAVPVRTTPWTLRLYAPIDERLAAGGRSGTLAGCSVAVLVITASGLALHRANRTALRDQEAASFGRQLQREVASRTAELKEANVRLRAEIGERQTAEATLARLQNDLAQANRLAYLGQIAAGVGHEINQPVAAIRTYADNAVIYLDRAQPESARRNLDQIAKLTETVGAITGELRSFSRKATGSIGPLELDEAVGGALRLTEPRLRQGAIELEDRVRGRGLKVIAERIRVEQILVNLIQNAAEALDGHGAPRIVLQAERHGGLIRVAVADNGPGISPDRLATLFTPFSTGKPNGLGLGLVVSQDLARDMGGTLTGRNAKSGAVFTLELDTPC